MKNDIVIQNIFPTNAEIQTLTQLGTMAVKSGFLPSTINTPEKAVIIMLKGRELGIPPMQAFSSIAIIQGKPTISAELMMALIYKNVHGAVVNVIETTAQTCVIEAQRPGEKSSVFSFTIEDARRAGLLDKGPWKTYPAAMLRARCISAMARVKFPDALAGLVYTPEELGGEPDTVEAEIVHPAPTSTALSGGGLNESRASSPTPAPKPNVPTAPPGASPTQGQLTKLFTAVTNRKALGWNEPRLRLVLAKMFGLDSTKLMTMDQYTTLLHKVEKSGWTSTAMELGLDANAGAAPVKSGGTVVPEPQMPYDNQMFNEEELK